MRTRGLRPQPGQDQRPRRLTRRPVSHRASPNSARRLFQGEVASARRSADPADPGAIGPPRRLADPGGTAVRPDRDLVARPADVRPAVLLAFPAGGTGGRAGRYIDRPRVGRELLRPARVLTLPEDEAGGSPGRPGDQLHDCFGGLESSLPGGPVLVRERAGPVLPWFGPRAGGVLGGQQPEAQAGRNGPYRVKWPRAVAQPSCRCHDATRSSGKVRPSRCWASASRSAPAPGRSDARAPGELAASHCSIRCHASVTWEVFNRGPRSPRPAPGAILSPASDILGQADGAGAAR